MSSSEADTAHQEHLALEVDVAVPCDDFSDRGHENNDGLATEGSNLPSTSGHSSNDGSQSQCGQSVIIVQNSNDLNIEDLEPSLLKCVKQVLTDTECQNSFMIISRGKDNGEQGEEQTTYIIELNSSEKQLNAPKEDHPCTSNHTVDSSTRASSGLISAELVSSVFSSKAADTSETKPVEKIAHPHDAPAFLDFGEQVEISVVSYPSPVDLNDAASETNISIEIPCPKNKLPFNSQQAPTLHTDEPAGCHETGSTTKDLQECDSLFSHTSQVTSTSKPCLVSSLLPIPAVSHETEIFTENLSSEKGSQISAEYLLHMAKKMIEEKTYSRKLTTRPQTPSDTSQGVESGEKAGSEPVITMYLSSPTELKDTIQKLKFNSPVIVLQAGNDDLSVSDKESKENDTGMGNNLEKPQSQKCEEDNSQANSSSEKFNSGLASTHSSLVDGGMVYRCAECGYSSHNKHYYKQHVDLVHNEDRPYKCPHCDYAGKRRHALLEHLVVHSNQRPFTCDHCNASFRKKGHLTNHIKLHTSQRLVHCGVCNIQLPDTDAFESHLRKIHKTDKLFKCRLCDYTVVDKEVMLKHLREHNEAVIYSCPKCPSLFNDEESLLTHMRGDHDFLFVQKSGERPNQAGSVCAIETISQPQPASIICSECGFVCGDKETMQKHMWVHIKKGDQQDIKVSERTKVSRADKDESCNTLGVLKMNVDLGQKTLPRNVVYQCSSCNFTSSDNSVFIKHMLAHKTQEKKQNAEAPENSKSSSATNQINETLTTTASLSKSKSAGYYPGSRLDLQARPGSGVPFIYDKASARFRCTICGYHCEFQRTIKAHIWKHSGHQSIEYPTFDQPGCVQTSTASQVVGGSMNEGFTKHLAGMPQLISNPHAAANADLSKSQSATDAIRLFPADFLKRSSDLRGIICMKGSSIFSADNGKNSTVSRLLEPGSGHDENLDQKPFIDLKAEKPNSKNPTNAVDASDKDIDEHAVMKVKKESQYSTAQSQSALYTCSMSLTSQFDANDKDDTRSSCDVDERFTEPSVVVEVMDTVPSGSGLTGMKSQQGSPRVLDLDGSAGEARLSSALKMYEEKKNDGDSDIKLESERMEHVSSDGAPPNVLSENSSKNHHSYSTRLRCPTCDCVLNHNFKAHLLSCHKRESSDKFKSIKQEKSSKSDSKKLTVILGDHDNSENPRAEDTDSVESSDEVTNSCGSSSQQKSGICSSLLAVIEQLRERSRSESEEDRQGPQSSKKVVKKKMRQDDEIDVLSVEDLQNIERISENGGEKFRCSLCHYSSHRICNIKLHMKTHRQKKPSECSLCEFSSSSPETLQDHMLKHCKVRTYTCKFCPQSFNHKSTLRAHLRAHKDQEPFLCAYCVYETTNPMEYREHMQVHSGCSSRLRCPGCDLIVSSKEELTAHLLICKGSTKTNEFVTDKAILNVEQELEKVEELSALESGATHHACVVHGCSFSSSNLKELQDHLSVHCNPSLLVCNLCDFKALHSRSLKSHMKRHANDQRYVQQPLEQYKCNLCGYVCHHLPSLKSHMWRHASDQSYSYEFTNDVINAAIDHDTWVDADVEADDPELLDRVINSERKILEGELTKCSKDDGRRPICWVTFRCCSCGFETINKAKLNIHMRSHSDIIQKALDIPRKYGNSLNKAVLGPLTTSKYASKRSNFMPTLPAVPMKVIKTEESVPM